MDKTVKAEWVKALRSGKYLQGRGQLRDQNNHFCCLGVLCDVNGADWENDRIGQRRITQEDEFYLRTAILKKFGFNHSTQVQLGMMNDNGKSFAEIADYIEKKL